MQPSMFHLHQHSHHEAVWGGLLVLLAVLLVALLIGMSALYGWQLPAIQPPPPWSGDFFKPITTPFGAY